MENVKFKQEWDACPRLTWSPANHGICDVKISLLFVQNDNSTQNVTVSVADESYENCNLTMKVKSVRYKTILMYNDKTLNESELSEDLTLQIMTTTTKTTTTTTIPSNTS